MRLFATARQFTGTPLVSRGYVGDRDTASIVWACPHRHLSRLRTGGKNGAYYAMRCAERQLRKMQRAVHNRSSAQLDMTP